MIAVEQLDLLTIEVGDTGLAGLRAARERVAAVSPHAADDVADAGTPWLTSVLDPAQQQRVADFRDGPHEALLLRGLSLECQVDTPSDGFLHDAECVLDFDLLHFSMLRLLGVAPFAVSFENDGKMVRNVVPVASAAGTTSSWGADVEFFWHSDNPNWPFEASPDGVEATPAYLAFTVVRNHEEASTDVVSGAALLDRLPAALVSELRRPAFVFSPPASNDGAADHARVLPVIEDSEQGPRVRFDHGAVRGVDTTATAALDELVGHLADVRGAELVLRPGDFFIFKNDRVLHRRKAFTPVGAGRSRWLRRCYAR